MLNSPCRCSPSVEERLDPLIINFFLSVKVSCETR